MGNKAEGKPVPRGIGNFLVDLMLEYAPISLLVVDSDGRIKGFNQKAINILNMPSEVWYGEIPLFNIAPFNEEKILAGFKKLKDTEKGFEFGIFLNEKEMICGVYPLKRVLNIPDTYVCFLKELKREESFAIRGKRMEDIVVVLLESIGDAVLVADADSKVITYGNRKALKLLGYSKKELIGLPITKLHPEDELERILFIFERQAKGELELAEDIPFVRKDGTIIYVDINSTRVNAVNRRYVVGVLRDITYKKALLSKLFKTNRLLEAIFEKTHLMFAFMSEDFRIIRVNQKFASTLGPGVEQFVGRNFFEIFNDPQLKRYFEEVALLKKSLVMKEFPLKRPDGKTVYVDFMLQALSEDRDDINGIIFSGTDVSELVHTKETLREVEYIKDTVLHELNELVSYITPDFEIKWANRPFLEYSVYNDFSELIGKKCFSALEDEHRQCDNCPVLKTLQDLKPHSAYVKFKTGREFYVRTFPDIHDGELKGVVAACLDITELRKREEKIERLNEMLRIIKNVNQVIMREEDVSDVIDKVTEVLSEKKDYVFVALLLTDHMGIPVLSSIKPGEYSEKLNKFVSRLNSGEIPTCLEKAFVSDKPVFVESEIHCAECEFFELCGRQKGILIKKLEYKGHIMGLIMVCTNREILKNNEEMELFEELADDVAYALYHIRS